MLTHKTRTILREAAIQKLGGKCNHCSISDIRVLDIDHINADGNIEREQLHEFEILRRIISGDFLDYQLLCANCHRLKTIEDRERLQASRLPRLTKSERRKMLRLRVHGGLTELEATSILLDHRS